MLFVVNREFETRPLVIHAHGPLSFKPTWPRIRDAFFSQPSRKFDMVPSLTLLTCNNGHQAMGLFERSASHLGLNFMVRGEGVHPWINSVSKPRVICDALHEIETEYVLYADSRDAILLNDPSVAIERFSKLDCELLFGGDRINWPALPRFHAFESRLPGAPGTQFRYLNGGAWIGRTEFCRRFFALACDTEPVPEARESEQGILKQLFMSHYPRIKLDYRCEIFQNIGFVFDDILDLVAD